MNIDRNLGAQNFFENRDFEKANYHIRVCSSQMNYVFIYRLCLI